MKIVLRQQNSSVWRRSSKSFFIILILKVFCKTFIVCLLSRPRRLFDFIVFKDCSAAAKRETRVNPLTQTKILKTLDNFQALPARYGGSQPARFDEFKCDSVLHVNFTLFTYAKFSSLTCVPAKNFAVFFFMWFHSPLIILRIKRHIY